MLCPLSVVVNLTVSILTCTKFYNSGTANEKIVKLDKKLTLYIHKNFMRFGQSKLKFLKDMWKNTHFFSPLLWNGIMENLQNQKAQYLYHSEWFEANLSYRHRCEKSPIIEKN